MKKTVRREQLLREEVEQKRLKSALELQYLLDRLGDDSVRQELRQGVGGSPLLTDADLSALDEFYKLVGPDRDQNVRWVQGHPRLLSCKATGPVVMEMCHYNNCCFCYAICRLADKYEDASSHLWDLLEGRDKAVVGTTCKSRPLRSRATCFVM